MDPFEILDQYKVRTLAQEVVTTLEEQLIDNPEDVSARTKLLGHFQSTGDVSKLVAHSGWMIDRFPLAAKLLTASFPEKTYTKLRDCWLGHIQNPRSSLYTVLCGTGFFLMKRDIESALACLPRIRGLVPSEKQAFAMARIYWDLHREAEGAISTSELLDEAIEWGQKAIVFDDDNHEEYMPSIFLCNLLFDSGRFDEAKHVAELLTAKCTENIQKHGYGFHIGHVILGKVAIVDEKLNVALNHLALCTQMPDSPLLAVNGPDLSLAQGLSNLGRTESVLSFLDKLDKFQLNEKARGVIDHWRRVIKDGKMP